MATKKELEIAAKAAKKTIVIGKKEIEKKKVEKQFKIIEATIPTIIEEEEVNEVKIIKTKAQLEVEEIELLREQLELDKKKEKLRRNKNEWDVKLGEPIVFFDPELSYELTGYRPITMTKGLDFVSAPFTEAGRIYDETGKYSTFREGSKLYDEFWDTQMERCKDGYTVGKYTITGDNYFWLNFYRLLNVTNIQKAAEGRLETFPDFFSKQYEYFHYIDLCEKSGFDVGSLKARGVGFSEIAASLGVRVYTTVAKSRCLYAAAAEGFVRDVLDKAWLQLEFLNTETQGGFEHVRMKKDSDMKKRASKVTTEGTEFGWMATLEGKVVDKPRKLRGGRLERLFLEEAGSNPILVTSYNQSEALVNILGKRIGSRFVWGTGGDEGPQLAGLAGMFYNPSEYNMLPYYHNHTENGQYVYTGFFIPAYTMHIPSCDSRGVCNEIDAKIYYNSIRVKKSSNAKNLLEYKSEYCFTPEEALIRQGDNRFDTELLAEQIANIELHKTVELPKMAKLNWEFSKEIGGANRQKAPSLEYTDKGLITIVEEPWTDENNIPYNNLYVAGIDSIDSDETSSTGQKDVSSFCIVIKRRQFGLKDPKYVAMYKYRPKDVRDAYDTAMKLLMYYNCKAVIETSRVSLITHFKTEKKLNLLFLRPRATTSDVNKANTRMYGCSATVPNINHYLDLVENYVSDYCHEITILDMLNELIKYSFLNKRKFDIVAAMGMCELADEELMGNAPRSSTKVNKEWQDIGYYTDENGYKQFGVIPKVLPQHNPNFTQPNYSWMNNDNTRN